MESKFRRNRDTVLILVGFLLCSVGNLIRLFCTEEAYCFARTFWGSFCVGVGFTVVMVGVFRIFRKKYKDKETK